MKKITSAVLMLSLLAIFGTSCKKDSDTVKDEKDLRSTKLSFKLEGASKTSTHLWAVYGDSQDQIGIHGTLSSSESISLAINDFDGNGEYDVDSEEAVIIYNVGNTTNAETYISTSGTVKITSITSSEVKGTFSGTLSNLSDGTKTVTDGKFEAKIFDEDEIDELED